MMNDHTNQGELKFDDSSPLTKEQLLRSDIHKARILDKLLSAACPADTDEEGLSTYLVQLHCFEFTIRARSYRHINNPNGSYKYSKFEVHSIDPRPEARKDNP